MNEDEFKKKFPGLKEEMMMEEAIASAQLAMPNNLKNEDWEKEFDSRFDYLNARHTMEQWDEYKAFILSVKKQAEERVLDEKYKELDELSHALFETSKNKYWDAIDLAK